MASGTPNRFRYNLLHSYLTGKTLKVLALKTTYTFDPDHKFVADIKAPTDYELSGTGYSRQTLTSVTITQDDTADRAVLDADDVTYTGINAGSIGFLLLYIDNGSDATNEIVLIDDTPDLTTNGADVTIVWSSIGIYLL